MLTFFFFIFFLILFYFILFYFIFFFNFSGLGNNNVNNIIHTYKKKLLNNLIIYKIYHLQ